MTSDQLITQNTITHFFQDLQDRICQALVDTDRAVGPQLTPDFREDTWQRPGGGGGRSRTLSGGNVIEKGGVGFSAVHGEATEATLRSLNLTEPAQFFATGVSIVIHPHSPMVPIIHMNVRYFEMSSGHSWFGGGIDLTPHYVVAEDAHWFHQQLKTVCDRHDPAYYDRFKPWADDYFYIPHRQETRGIGGIFFDYLKPDSPAHKADLFAFVQDVGNAFAPIYTHFMRQNQSIPYGEREKQWQFQRRGRYVEFNLVWDRGTKFGLETNGRTESILMSMPPQANWTYDFRPEAGSREEETLGLLKKGNNWAN
ncbi:oxygen-dependent coproporphyrinogen oxidase [Spirosoma sp. KUDC1026]|uniref:oxygen-dependent coproporphyrinogen oxidase n=1 Tax=Spirosoma sp. KUDC1026 TaxID=2745947 RepID=UPI00159B95DF|nr:oxygen-dependent coproporphyrinogen oxidase [Spirosoma sp. KUDC1026]QKZ15768.1 oxygen-dependent coproporphyrinogen oxidase [Spirosoma sp. KUDC1026]